MNNRLKEIRLALDLTQEKFSQKIGISQKLLSYLEINKRKLQDRHIKLICLTFNVNERWLLHGEGNMFSKDNRADLPDEFAGLKLSPEDREFILNYLRMPEDSRRKFMSFFREFVTPFSE